MALETQEIQIPPEKVTIQTNPPQIGDLFTIKYYTKHYEVYKYLGPYKKPYEAILCRTRKVADYVYNPLGLVEDFTVKINSTVGSVHLTNELIDHKLDLVNKIPAYDKDISISNTELIENDPICIDNIYYVVHFKFRDQFIDDITTSKLSKMKTGIRAQIKRDGYKYIGCDISVQNNKFAITLIDKTPPPPPEKPAEEPKINRLNLISFK